MFPLQNKLEGTVWMDVDDAKVFKVLDLDDIEKTFSAYQRQQVVRMLQSVCPQREVGGGASGFSWSISLFCNSPLLR